MHQPKDPMLFDAEAGGLLFDPATLRVITGPRDLLARASRYERALSIDDLSEDERRTVERIRACLSDSPLTPPRYEGGPRVTQLNIANTYFCNMGCTYCYNELDNKVHKGSESPEGMSSAVARAMVDALFAQAGDATALTLVFIGGEALVEKNVMYETVSYARERGDVEGKRVLVTVYTNGTLMDDAFLAWARDVDARMVLSLDGPPEINDRSRIYRNGKGTGRRVLRNIRRMMDVRSDARVRTVTAVTNEPSELLPLAKYLLALGFNEIQIQAAYGADGFGDRGKAEDAAELLAWYRDLLLSGVVVGIAPFVNILGRLALRGGMTISWYPCAAGHGALGVAPSGDVFPCHHFLEEDGYRLGNVRDGLPTSEQREPYFRRVDQREPCSSCWARHACGGECYHRANTAGRGYFGVMDEVCAGRKQIIAMALEVFAEVATKRPDVLRRLVLDDYSRVPVHDEAYDATDLVAFGARARPRRVGLPVISHG